MYCARCGKKGYNLIEGLCPSCFIYTRGIDVNVTDSVHQCSVCHRIRINNRWTDSQDELRAWLERKITDRLAKVFSKYGLAIVDVKLAENSYEAKVAGEKYSFTFEGKVNLTVSKTICPICLKEKQESYEAVVQIRVEDKADIGKVREIIDKVLRAIPSERAGEILSIEELKEGIDLKVYSHSTARFIANRITALFPSELKEAHKLITVKGGRRYSKLTMSVRLLKTKGYEVVYYKNKPALITYLSSGRIGILLHDGNLLVVDRKFASRDIRAFRGTVEEAEITNVDGHYLYVKKGEGPEERIPLARARVLAPVGHRALLVEDDDGEMFIFPMPQGEGSAH